MRLNQFLFSSTLLLILGCSENESISPECDSVDAAEFSTVYDVPDDYSGDIKICSSDKIAVIGTFINGKKNGIWKEYSNGILFQKSTYLNNKLDGKFSQFHISGNDSIKANYKNGRLSGQFVAYYDDGQIEINASYHKGKLSGVYKEYFSDGQLKLETNYSDGKLDGMNTHYFEDGKKYMESKYSNGRLNGTLTVYNQYGKIVLKEIYTRGELIETIGRGEVPDQYLN